MMAPVSSERIRHCLAQPFFDRCNRLGDAFVMIEGADVFAKIAGPRCAATKRVDFRAGEAIKVIELHWGERRAELNQFPGRLVKLSAFIIGADDEYPHIELA